MLTLKHNNIRQHGGISKTYKAVNIYERKIELMEKFLLHRYFFLMNLYTYTSVLFQTFLNRVAKI